MQPISSVHIGRENLRQSSRHLDKGLHKGLDKGLQPLVSGAEPIGRVRPRNLRNAWEDSSVPISLSSGDYTEVRFPKTP